MRAKRAASVVLPDALAASTVFLVTPAFAEAADQSCDTIAALTAPGVEAMRNIAIGYDPKGFLELRLKGEATFIHSADDCELSSASSYLYLQCSWDLDGNENAASEKAEELRKILDGCLPSPLALTGRKSSVDGLEIPLDYELDIELPSSAEFDDEEIEISLSIFKYTHGPNKPRYKVHLTFER